MMKFAPHRTIKYYYLRLIRLRGGPHFLALGVSIGAFVGVTPTIPFHTILALLLSFLFRASKLAALLATVLVSNPLTFFIQYYLAWMIGNWIIPNNISWAEINAVLEIITDRGFMESLDALGRLGGEAITTLIVGGCLLALPIAIISYIVSLRFFFAAQKRRWEKEILNQKTTG